LTEQRACSGQLGDENGGRANYHERVKQGKSAGEDPGHIPCDWAPLKLLGKGGGPQIRKTIIDRKKKDLITHWVDKAIRDKGFFRKAGQGS